MHYTIHLNIRVPIHNLLYGTILNNIYNTQHQGRPRRTGHARWPRAPLFDHGAYDGDPFEDRKEHPPQTLGRERARQGDEELLRADVAGHYQTRPLRCGQVHPHSQPGVHQGAHVFVCVRAFCALCVRVVGVCMRMWVVAYWLTGTRGWLLHLSINLLK